MDNKDKVIVGPFPNHTQGFIRYTEALLKYGAEGYKLPTEKFNKYAGLQCGAALRVFLYKDKEGSESVDEVVVEPEVVVEVDESEKLESLKKDILSKDAKIKKVDLLWVASKLKAEIPEDIKLPLQIKKFLKDFINSKG